jgi:hypothetical protein
VIPWLQLPNAQDLRCAADWRAGCPAIGMTDKAIRSGRLFGKVFEIVSGLSFIF